MIKREGKCTLGFHFLFNDTYGQRCNVKLMNSQFIIYEPRDTCSTNKTIFLHLFPKQAENKLYAKPLKTSNKLHVYSYIKLVRKIN